MKDKAWEDLVKSIQKYLNQHSRARPLLLVDGDLGRNTYNRAQFYQDEPELPDSLKTIKPPAITKLTDWRLAESLVVLRAQINSKWPNRNKASDGTIGDARHASQNSDHNAWIKDKNGQPVVTAFDVTHDPANGVDCTVLAGEVITDPRVKYVIWDGRIWNITVASKWRKYTGSNPHTKHMHISVSKEQDLYDNKKPWGI